MGQDCIFQDSREKDNAVIEMKSVEHLNGSIACLNRKAIPRKMLCRKHSLDIPLTDNIVLL